MGLRKSYLRTAQRVRTFAERLSKPRMDELTIIGEWLYRQYKLAPYNPDDLFLKKGYVTYDKMLNDAQVLSCLNTLKYGRIQSGWDIQPATDDNVDVKIAEFCKYCLNNVDGTIEADMYEIYSAIDKGWALSEIVWKIIETGEWKGKVGIKALKEKDVQFYNTDVDKFGNIQPNGIVSLHPLQYGQQFPIDKFIIYSFQKKYESTFGRPLLRVVYRHWWSKDVIIKFWNIFLEKFGSPTVQAKYKGNLNPADEIKLDEVLKSLQTETAVKLPEGLDLELLEATRRGEASYLAAIEYHDRQIAKAILGETLTSEAGKVGSYALGEIHLDILRMHIEKIGSDMENEVMDEQVIKRLVDYNFTNVTEYPKFKFKPLLKEDMMAYVDKYLAGVEKGAIQPTEEDEKHIREIIKFPPREVEKEQPEFREFAKKFRRELTKYEKKVDFAEIEHSLDESQEDTIMELSSIVQRQVEGAKLDIVRKQILERKNIREIDRLELRYENELKLTLEKCLKETYLDARNDTRKEIRKALKKFQKVTIEPLAPEEALAYFKSKTFQMAGGISGEVKKRVQNVLYNAIKMGKTLKETMYDIDEAMRPFFLPEGQLGDGGELLTPARLETIVRTNMTEAYNQGRKDMILDPDLTEDVPAIMYSAILDARTTEVCEKLDGMIVHRDNPLLDRITPPNHFNCRSVLVPVMAYEKYELTPDEDVEKAIILIPTEFK